MMKNKITLVLGASLKENRISNRLIRNLSRLGIPVRAVGLVEGMIGNVQVQTGQPDFKDIHTVSLYLNERNQAALEDYILALEPRRIIFNPGAENPSLKMRARESGIEAINACNLVMLSTGQY